MVTDYFFAIQIEEVEKICFPKIIFVITLIQTVCIWKVILFSKKTISALILFLLALLFFPVKVPQCKIMYNFGHEKSKIIHLSYFYMILRPK